MFGDVGGRQGVLTRIPGQGEDNNPEPLKETNLPYSQLSQWIGAVAGLIRDANDSEGSKPIQQSDQTTNLITTEGIMILFVKYYLASTVFFFVYFSNLGF